MARDPAQILHEALELPIGVRAALADSLLDSLDTEIDEGAEQLWRKEVEHRLADIDSGKVKLIPQKEAQKRLRARLKH